MRSNQQTDFTATKQQIMLLVQSARLAEANTLCTTLCKEQPNDAEAWFLLAAINGQLGNFPDAEKCSRKAVKLCPTNPVAHYNQAFARFRLGKLAKAEKDYRRALEINPKFAEAHHDLANLLMETGRHKLAIEHFQHAITENPSFSQAYYNLGRALDQNGQANAAAEYYRKATQLLPCSAEAHFRLGNSLYSAGEYNKAAEAYKAAIAVNNNYAEAYNNLGNTLKLIGDSMSAMAAYREAIRSKHDYAEAYNNLGNNLKDSGKLEEAIDALNMAISINNDFTEAVFNLATALQANGLLHQAESTYKKALSQKPIPQAANNLGNLLVTQGRVKEAEEYYRKAIISDPKYAEAHSNLLFCLNYKIEIDLDLIYREHREWEKFHATGATNTTHSNNPSPGRVLVIGYISPDFYQHSVAFFVEALLFSHNRENFKIICYADVKRPDETTERLRNLADVWHHTTNTSDDELAALIKHDCVDILVDLAGHTQGNRLIMLAGKPAPIQVSYIGYPNTTGLSTIDYRITDALSDPDDSQEKYTETLLRIPDCFLCYTPPSFQDPPKVSPLPAKSNGYITFGSFNNLAKLNTEVAELWSGVLNSIPNSRLVLKNKALVDKLTHQYYIDMFRQHGIDKNRIELISWAHSTREHLLLYNQIDMALDTFPYNGTTTSCEALWMGVPVISLYGDRHASRVGRSLLCNTGLPEFVASTKREFKEIATSMANNIAHLSKVRTNLRGQLLSSTLCDREKHCSNVENIYRRIWGDWCQKAIK